jgi:hypothetical protein
VIALATAATVASGGPNAGGALIVHDTGLVGSIGPDEPRIPAPASCRGADVTAPLDQDCVWAVYAAFPETSSPRLLSATFAVAAGPALTVVESGFAPGSTGVPDLPPGTGVVTVTFASPRTETVTLLGWFAGYATEPGTFFRLQEIAGWPVSFLDDALPPQTDEVLGLGRLGFGYGGRNSCPSPLGACCTCESDCRVLTREECGDRPWQMDMTCDPNPCLPVFDIDGACCLPDGSCLTLEACRCEERGGIFHGPGSDCGPFDPCRTQIEVRSWGRLKAHYR